MFENLSDRLNRTITELRGQGRLTEDNIKDTLRDVRMALLEADVALPVVRDFVSRIKERALGEQVMQSLTPGQALVKIVQQELEKTLGEENEALDLRAQPPAVVLMAGLQGSGKTTSTGKLAKHLVEKQKKSVAVVSADVYRPAAIEQLKTVAEQVGVQWIESSAGEKPVDIAKRALDFAKKQHLDVLIIDTAGRLGIDEAMMSEIQALHTATQPAETLFVVDAMSGQDAANTAKAFGDALPLTGVVLTKVDGDARGGAALSVRHVTGKPIKFLGVGEKLDALEPFHPQRIASRILGMGDVLSLIEEAEAKIDKKKAEKFAKKVAKGKGFDLSDFREQMQQMQSMGGVGALLDKLPGGAQLQAQAAGQIDEKQISRTIAIINSMTPQERQFPALIKASRKRRIAAGSGVQVQEVNKLLKQFASTQKMMKKFAGGGMAKMMRRMGNMPGLGGGMGGGGMPPGMGRR